MEEMDKVQQIINDALYDESDPDLLPGTRILEALDDADLLNEDHGFDHDDVIAEVIDRHQEMVKAHVSGRSLSGMIYDALKEVGAVTDPALEEQFADTASKINRKLKEASIALKEANRLAKEASLPAIVNAMWLREELDGKQLAIVRNKLENIDVSDLESEIEQAGWSTSAAYC